MLGLFITGTDTGVGKTFVTCRLVRHLLDRGVRIGAYKPVCSGGEFDATGNSWRWSDIEQLAAALQHRFSTDLICPQRFRAPLAPPVAARLESVAVESERLIAGASAWEPLADLLLVEGVGGWKCPLTETETVADFALKLGFPVLLVSAQKLGTISQTLLTVESIQRSPLPLVGIVMNQATATPDDTAASNAREITRFADVPLLAELPFFREVTASGGRQSLDDVMPVSPIGTNLLPPDDAATQLRLADGLASIDWLSLIERANRSAGSGR